MSEVITIWQKRGKDEATLIDLKKGDRIITPSGDEYSVGWNNVRKCLEITKTFSEGDSSISITPYNSNHIFIK